MLQLETNKLIWDYDIPQSLEYLIEPNDQCPICRNTGVKIWSAPFIVANIPYDQIYGVLEKYYGFIATPEMIDEHRKHIRVNIVTDAELEREFKEQMKLIESDTPIQIDEKQVLESLIRGLFARKLFLEKTQTYGKEYALITQQLKQAIELKLRMKDELKEASEKVALEDVIKLFKYAKSDVTESRPAVTTGKVYIRDGRRESIKHFVRVEGCRYQSSSRINIPY